MASLRQLLCTGLMCYLVFEHCHALFVSFQIFKLARLKASFGLIQPHSNGDKLCT